MMKRFSRLPVCPVMTGLLAAGAVAGSAVAANAGTVGTCNSSGNQATCAAAGTATKPLTLTLTVTVTSSPDQTVFVAWDTECSQNGGALKKLSGTFTATTPVTRTISHAYTQPGMCIVAAAAALTNSGAVHVSVSSSSTAPAKHEIKGYANLCADDAGNSTARGNKIETWACNNGAAEQWAFSHGELVHRGMCMADKSGGGSGSRVVLNSCNGSAAELWSHNSRGEYVLKARNGTLCLTDPGYSKKNGAQLVISACHNTVNQRWTLP